MAAVTRTPVLVVRQLPVSIQERDIVEIFSRFGQPTKISLLHDLDNSSDVNALAHFNSWSEAETAMEALNGTIPDVEGIDDVISVQYATPEDNLRSEEEANDAGISPKKVYLTRIGKYATDTDISELFSQYGSLEFVNVIRTKTGAAGCAFVQFSRWKDAEEAIRGLHESYIMHGCKQPMIVKFANAPRLRTRSGVGAKDPSDLQASHLKAKRGLYSRSRTSSRPTESAFVPMHQYSDQQQQMSYLLGSGFAISAPVSTYNYQLPSGPHPVTMTCGIIPIEATRQSFVGTRPRKSRARKTDEIRQASVLVNSRAFQPAKAPKLTVDPAHHDQETTSLEMHRPEMDGLNSEMSQMSVANPPLLTSENEDSADKSTTSSKDTTVADHTSIAKRDTKSMASQPSQVQRPRSTVSRQQGTPLVYPPPGLQYYYPSIPYFTPFQPGNGQYVPSTLTSNTLYPSSFPFWETGAALEAMRQSVNRPLPGTYGKLGYGVQDPSMYEHKLFIGQIPYDFNEHGLWDLFSPHGNILELAILRSKGVSKGCAFLTYSTRGEAEAAISNMNGRFVLNKQLVVKFADRKGEDASVASDRTTQTEVKVDTDDLET